MILLVATNLQISFDNYDQGFTPHHHSPLLVRKMSTNLNQPILAPISLGELIDKITILEIKCQHLQGHALQNVRKELQELERTLEQLPISVEPSLRQELKAINQNLWRIEDAIRDQERRQDFGPTFIGLARSVYQQNDTRAAIKKSINQRYNSALTEEKSYQPY